MSEFFKYNAPILDAKGNCTGWSPDYVGPRSHFLGWWQHERLYTAQEWKVMRYSKMLEDILDECEQDPLFLEALTPTLRKISSLLESTNV